MPALPKNIATMNDDERIKWWTRLPEDVYYAIKDRTFKGPPEYFIYYATMEEEEGETQGPLIYDKKDEAVKEYKRIITDERVFACRLEKVVGTYNVIDADLEDRNYTTLMEKGKFLGEEDE